MYFKDIIGQEFAKKYLTNSINKDKVSHAYLFEGMNGVGKKTLAKEFAKILIKELCKVIREEKKEPVLFVQVKNESAKRAYRQVGFTYQSDYTICYYK
jgi:DNA polymerase III delta prime subunit